jgi:uncharacterized coiled-coil protein SlyX
MTFFVSAIATVAWAVGGTALVGGAVLISGFQLGLILASSALSQYANYQNKKKRKEAEEASKGTQLTIESSVYVIPIAYGRVKIGGARTYHNVRSDMLGFQIDRSSVYFNSYSSEDWTKWRTDVASHYLKATVAVVGGAYTNPTNTEGIPWTDITPANQLELRERHEPSLGGARLFRSGDGTNLYNVKAASLAGQAWLFAGLKVLIYHDSFLDTDAKVGVVPPVGPMELPYLIKYYDAGQGYMELEGLDPSSSGMLGEPSEDNDVGYEEGKKNDHMYFRQVLCYEGIHNFLYAEADEQSIHTDKFKIRAFFYPMGGTEDPMMWNNFESQRSTHYWEAATIAVVAVLNRDEPQYSGVPSITTQLEGMKVAELLQSSNYPPLYGLGAPIYSNNPVRVLIDYLTNKNYGKGLSISELDLESFYLAAKIANRLVPVNGQFDLQPRGPFWLSKQVINEKYNLHLFEFNGVLETSNDIRSNVETILSALGDAYLSWAEGKYYLIFTYHVPYEPVFTYTSLGSLTGTPVVVGQPSFYDKDDTVYYESDVEFGYPVTYLARSTVDGNLSDPRDPTTHGLSWVVTSPYSLVDGAEPSANNYTGYGLVQEIVTDDDIILDTEVSYTWNDSAARYNFCTVQFNSDEKSFREDSASWPPKYSATNPIYETYLAEDNGYFLENEVTLSYCSNYYHALAYAEYIVRMSRSKTVIKMGVNRRLIAIIPGDIIRVDSEYLNIPNQLIRVTETKPTTFKDAGILEITGYIYDPRQLAWNAKDDEIIEDAKFYSDQVRQATNLTFTPEITYNASSMGELNWDAAEDATVEKYAILITNVPPESVTSETAWNELTIVPGTKAILPLMNYNYYTVAVVSISSGGKRAPQMDISSGSHWPLLAIIATNSTLSFTVDATPPSILVQDDANGNINYGPAASQLKVSKGNVDLTASSTYAISQTFYCTAVVSPTGLVQITSMVSSTAACDVDITVDGKVYNKRIYAYYGGGQSVGGAVGITPKPEGVQISAGFTFYYVECEPISFAINHGYRSTRVYAALKISAAAPTVDQAKIAIDAFGFGHFIDAHPGDIWYVWVAFVANNLTESIKVGPFIAQTGLNTTAIFDKMQNEIGNTVLQKDIALDITELEADIVRLENTDLGLSGNIISIQEDITSLEAGQASANVRITAVETENGSQASSITTLNAGLANAEVRITATETVNGTQASSITNLDAGLANANVRITATETVNGTQATSITDLNAGLANANVRITATETVNGTQSESITTLNAGLTSAVNRISATETVNGQQATAITDLIAKDTQITQSMSALQTSDGSQNTNWSIKSQIAAGAGGVPYITGVGLFSSNGAAGPTSSFNVMVDSFVIGAPNFGAVPFEVHTGPFTVDGYNYPAGVYALNLIVKDAQITNAKIATAAVDTAKIRDLAVSTAKIDNLAVDTGKIRDLAVQTLKVAGKAVTVGMFINISDITPLNAIYVTNAYPLNLPVAPSGVSFIVEFHWTPVAGEFEPGDMTINLYRDSVTSGNLVKSKFVDVIYKVGTTSIVVSDIDYATMDIIPSGYNSSPNYIFTISTYNAAGGNAYRANFQLKVSILANMR